MNKQISRASFVPLLLSAFFLLSFACIAAAQKDSNAEQPTNPALEKILATQPDTFSATEISEYGGNGSALEILRVRKGDKYRIETEQRGIKVIIILRPDLKNSFILRPDKKLYTEGGESAPPIIYADPFNLRQVRKLAARNVKIENLGKETVAGYACDKYRISFDQANQIQSVTVWKATGLGGLIIRQEMEFGNTKSSFEFRNISLDVTEDMFELPKEFKVVPSRAELFKLDEKE